MIAKPNLSTYQLARGEETGALSVSRIRDGLVLWSGQNAHQGAITDLAWSHDNQLLASAGQDGIVRIWQAHNGELLCSFAHGEYIERVRWSAHGMLASASSTRIRLWSLALTSAGTVVA